MQFTSSSGPLIPDPCIMKYEVRVHIRTYSVIEYLGLEFIGLWPRCATYINFDETYSVCVSFVPYYQVNYCDPIS